MTAKEYQEHEFFSISRERLELVVRDMRTTFALSFLRVLLATSVEETKEILWQIQRGTQK